MLDYVGNLREIESKLPSLMEDNPQTGRFRVARDIFTDPDLFELEMKHIWEGNWIYLAHETQIPNKNDYFTMYMGRQPILIARNRNGELNAFINACSHRGAMLCRHKKANKSTYTCPFHGWTFNNSGKLLKVKDPDGGGYPESFNKDGSHDLTKVPRFESYRGFLFGSLNPDVKPLKEHLGVWIRDVLGAREDLKGLGQAAGIERRVVMAVGAGWGCAEALAHDRLG